VNAPEGSEVAASETVDARAMSVRFATPPVSDPVSLTEPDLRNDPLQRTERRIAVVFRDRSYDRDREPPRQPEEIGRI
jgi:hypothetical protein